MSVTQRRLQILQASAKRIENLAIKEARRIASRIRRLATSAYRTRKVKPIIGEYEKLLPIIEQMMLAGHLTGMKGSVKVVKLANPFDKVIESLESLTNLTKLRDKYHRIAIDIISDASKKVNEELRDFLNDVIKSGLPTRAGTKLLTEKLDSLGLTPNNPYTIESIVRTQNMIAHSAGRWQADQDPDVQEILWGYTYVTVGDDRVRPEHAALDGVTLPKNDPFWKKYWPPNGWSCRCMTIPVFEKRDIVRPSKNIDVPKDFQVNFGEVLG